MRTSLALFAIFAFVARGTACAGKNGAIGDNCDVGLNYCKYDTIATLAVNDDTGDCADCSPSFSSNTDHSECIDSATHDNWQSVSACFRSCEVGHVQAAGNVFTEKADPTDPQFSTPQPLGFMNQQNIVTPSSCAGQSDNDFCNDKLQPLSENARWNNDCQQGYCDSTAGVTWLKAIDMGGWSTQWDALVAGVSSTGTDTCRWVQKPDSYPCQIKYIPVTQIPGITKTNVAGTCFNAECLVISKSQCDLAASNNVVTPGCPPPPEACDEGYTTGGFTYSAFDGCSSGNFGEKNLQFSGSKCANVDSQLNCPTIGNDAYQLQNLICWTQSEPTTSNGSPDVKAQDGHFTTHYHNPNQRTTVSDNQGRCIFGENPAEDTCVIGNTGLYTYDTMIVVYQQGNLKEIPALGSAPAFTPKVTLLSISEVRGQSLSPWFECDSSKVCHANYNCQWSGNPPCADQYPICVPMPTASPTSAHGDPIIWTFNDECYDLNKDGFYLASAHESYDHEVRIAVHNDYMREIQVLSSKGEMLLSINNFGEYVNNDYPFKFSHEVKKCPVDMKECIFNYHEFKFDAQAFEYTVQTLSHDYLDPALKEGETGVHLDIYPRPYKKSFAIKQLGFTGLFFENPLPEELEYCRGGSPQR